MIHFRTFFKKSHKFAYINPTSNHAKHVFKGLIRTECLRYIRNSLTNEHYMTSVGLFYKSLRKIRYHEGFLKRNFFSYDEGRRRPMTGCGGGGQMRLAVYPMLYDQDVRETWIVERILKQAMRGLVLPIRLIIAKMVKPKMRNIFSTRKILHKKMEQFGFFLS